MRQEIIPQLEGMLNRGFTPVYQWCQQLVGENLNKLIS